MNRGNFDRLFGRLLWIIAAAFVMLLATGHVSADGLTKGDAGKGTDVPDGVLQQNQALAYNPVANNYLVVWRDNETPTGTYDVYGRLVSSTGDLTGQPIAIGIGSESQQDPAIAYNASLNEYLVVWADFRSGSHWQVYGQRMAANGSLIGSNYLISSSPADAEVPSLVYNSTSHGYMVVWQDNRTYSPLHDIYVRVLSDTGVPTANPVSVWPTPAYDDKDPVIAYNPSSNLYLVAWETVPNIAGAEWDVVSSALNTDGSFASAKVPIGVAPGLQLGPSLAYNPVNNQMLVVWCDRRNGEPNTWAAMVSSTGSLVGSAFDLYTGPNPQVWPYVAWNNNSAIYLVTWQDFRSGVSYDIYGRTVGYNGVVSPEFPISTAPDWQEYPRVAANGSSFEFLVTFGDKRNDLGDIYGQRIANGALIGSDFPIAPGDCTLGFTDVPPGSTFYPEIACLVCHGIVNGYADGTFRPGNSVTRGQLAKIVANSAGFNEAPGAQLFQDVPPGSTFFDYIQRLATRGYVSGYPCGGPGEPCIAPGNLMYFRPNANASRGQISKIVSNSAGFNDTHNTQRFEDVPVSSTFYIYIERLASRNVMSGYSCGGTGEPCIAPGNRPYFRPNNNATRGQVSKIVSGTFLPTCVP